MVGLAICAQTSVADLFEVDGWPSWDGSGEWGPIQVKFLSFG